MPEENKPNLEFMLPVENDEGEKVNFISSDEKESEEKDPEKETDDVTIDEEGRQVITLPFAPPEAGDVNDASDRNIGGKRSSMRKGLRERRRELEESEGANVHLVNLNNYTEKENNPLRREPARNDFSDIDLDEEMQIHLNEEQLLKIISYFMNQRYKKEGFEVDENISFQVNSEVSSSRTVYKPSINIKLKRKKKQEDDF